MTKKLMDYARELPREEFERLLEEHARVSSRLSVENFIEQNRTQPEPKSARDAEREAYYKQQELLQEMQAEFERIRKSTGLKPYIVKQIEARYRERGLNI